MHRTVARLNVIPRQEIISLSNQPCTHSSKFCACTVGKFVHAQADRAAQARTKATRSKQRPKQEGRPETRRPSGDSNRGGELHSGGGAQRRRPVGALPREVGLGTPEMTVGGRLRVDRPEQ